MPIFFPGRYRDDLETAPPLPDASSTDAQALFLRATAWLERGDWSAAAVDFAAASQIRPGFFRARLGEAVALAQIPIAEPAVAICRDLAGTCADAEVVIDAAHLLSTLIGPESALPAFERAVSLAPDSIETLYAAGFAHAMDGDPYRARTHFEQLLRLCDPLEQVGLVDQVIRFLQSLPVPPSSDAPSASASETADNKNNGHHGHPPIPD